MADFAEQTGVRFANVPGVGGSQATPDGMVRFQPDPPSVFPVTAWSLTESWAVNAGDGQIDRVAIPRRTARTVWRGRDPITMQGKIRLSGGPRRLSIEAACRALDYMAGRGRRGTPTEPTALIVDANGAIPYDCKWQPDLRWWIEGIEWETESGPEGVVRREDWHRVLQVATVQLVQIVRGPLALTASSSEQARDRLIRDTRKTVVVKKGDTLRSIANRYGVNWEDIARLNNIDHPSSLKVGRTLRLPS